MKGYRRKSRFFQTVISIRTLPHRLSIFFLILLSLILIVIGQVDRSQTLDNTKAIVTEIVSPLTVFISRPAHTIKGIIAEFQNYFFVYQKNQQLLQENIRLKKIQQIADMLSIENKQLKQYINYVPEPGVTFISSRISGISTTPYIKTATINTGTADSIKKNQIVINESGIVGKIHDVGKNSAKVMLITDINSRIPVITGETKQHGIAAGTMQPIIDMIYTTEDNQIKVGELVYTSGDGKLFPHGLLVGRVYSNEENYIKIKPAVNWSNLEFVSVVEYEVK